MIDAEKKAAADKAAADKKAADKAAADAKALAEMTARAETAEEKNELLEQKAVSDAEQINMLKIQNDSLNKLRAKTEAKAKEVATAVNTKKVVTEVKKKKLTLGQPFEVEGKQYRFKMPRFAYSINGVPGNYTAESAPEKVKAALVKNKQFGVIELIAD